MKSFAIPLIAGILAATAANAASTFDSVAVDVFARDAYSTLYTLDGAAIDQQIGEARSLFASDEKHQSYVDSLKASGDYDILKANGLKMAAAKGDATVKVSGNGKWTVTFPAEISFSGKLNVRQCLAVTMNVAEAEGRLSVVNAISTQGECLDTSKD
ncbi:Macrophage killing protein with similarity to conjugation protein [compost metagenome]